MSSTLYCMLMGILLFCPETDCASIEWKAPPPTQTISKPAASGPEEHLSSTSLLEGTINASLSWQFTLSSDLSFVTATLKFNDTTIGGAIIFDKFKDQYAINSIPSERVSLVIFHVTNEVDGIFVCEVAAQNAQGALVTFTSKIQVDIIDPPSNISASSDLDITAPADLTLNCSANGKPEPTITWTRLSDNTIVTMPLKITGRKDAGDYRCTADNGVGNPLTEDVSIIVLFRPKISLPKKFYVGRGKNVSLTCTVDGNPTPTISWTPCDLPNHVCDKQYLNISKVKTARTTYICNASNYLGSDSATTVLFIGGVNIYLRLSTGEKCEKEDSVRETLKNELDEVFAQDPTYIEAELIGASCGSLIFDLVLKFNTEVAEDDIISAIKDAIVDGKLGELTVNTSSIIGIPPIILSTTTVSTTTTPESDSTHNSSALGGEGGNIWIIVGAVLGAVALVVIIAVIVWCVRKNKCSNGTKEVSDGNDAGQGKGGGAQGQNAGDESAYDSAYSNASVLPPSKKPTSTGKEDAGQAIALPVYAQVDKSKKKPRSEKEAQRQPGELLYVQADHSNEGSLPTKASGNPSRPPPYQDTVYADLV